MLHFFERVYHSLLNHFQVIKRLLPFFFSLQMITGAIWYLGFCLVVLRFYYQFVSAKSCNDLCCFCYFFVPPSPYPQQWDTILNNLTNLITINLCFPFLHLHVFNHGRRWTFFYSLCGWYNVVLTLRKQASYIFSFWWISCPLEKKRHEFWLSSFISYFQAPFWTSKLEAASTISTSFCSKGLIVLRQLLITEEKLGTAHVQTGHGLWNIKSSHWADLFLIFSVYMHMKQVIQICLVQADWLSSSKFQDSFLQIFSVCESHGTVLLLVQGRLLSAWDSGVGTYIPLLSLLWMFHLLTSLSLSLQKRVLTHIRSRWGLSTLTFV